MQLTLTLKMTTAQVVETLVTVNNNSPIQDYVHPDDQTQPTFEMTPGFKPFTDIFSVPKSQNMVTPKSSHVKDKNSIFTARDEDVIFLVKGKILVFHQYLYNKTH